MKKWDQDFLTNSIYHRYGIEKKWETSGDGRLIIIKSNTKNIYFFPYDKCNCNGVNKSYNY